MKKMFSFKGKITETDDKTKQEQKKNSTGQADMFPTGRECGSQRLATGFPRLGNGIPG
ncbi:hypothetical protein J4864_00565 [Prevotella multiformis]|uniref:hypothetical protein n=1 Tax=Prevotella multiformis TaxID=282402 RepID=UPI001BADB719|nr:hypothetical protein [Prevotella multiformis]QUB70765.1 hypothetical protein J4864_00565 [Prevotella multiformis]